MRTRDVAESATLVAGSAPGGFRVGSNYVFSGTAPANDSVVIWWSSSPTGPWRQSVSGTVSSSGAYRLQVKNGSAARFYFAATSGHVPGSAAPDTSWEAPAVKVNSYPAGSDPTRLAIGSAPGGFQVGSALVMSGTTTPNTTVTIWWQVYPFGQGWRTSGTVTSGADGRYTFKAPISDAARLRFAATEGSQPGTPAPGIWTTYPTYVNTGPAGAAWTTLSAGSAPGGYQVGANYVFSGRTIPGLPVVLWWYDASRGWRISGSMTADSRGYYRYTAPITDATTTKFTATSGHIPGTYPAGGWATQVVTVSTVRYQNPAHSMRLDSRCLTGRAICISKSQRKLAWVVNGRILMTVDVRFGSELTPTREGSFKVNSKSRNHVSSLYHTSMPYALFFSGGQAVHYSADFAARGYNGSSHGCVNVRDKSKVAGLFDLARVGDKVIVYK